MSSRITDLTLGGNDEDLLRDPDDCGWPDDPDNDYPIDEVDLEVEELYAAAGSCEMDISHEDTDALRSTYAFIASNTLNDEGPNRGPMAFHCCSGCGDHDHEINGGDF